MRAGRRERKGRAVSKLRCWLKELSNISANIIEFSNNIQCKTTIYSAPPEVGNNL